MTIPTTNPTTYTVPESKVWLSPDGRDSFWFYANDVIPMAMAIRMGMPGAGYDTTTPFTPLEEQRIADLIDQQASAGVPTLLPTFWNRAYTNRTAGAGVETPYTIYPFTMVGGLIRVEEAGKMIVGVGARVTAAASGASLRFSVYGVYLGTDSARGLAGTRIADLGAVSAATTGYKQASGDAITPPGLYWVFAEPSHELTIAGFQSHVDHLGSSTVDGAIRSGMSYNVGESMAAHPASLNGGNEEPLAPLVYVFLDDAA